ncbi:MAG: ATP phosphoribosyltransferase [Termitinemataceae bacterium]|nr:MAG: ATP phosphoribosyltransferase [Termitinemataceae bacterium]
MPIFVKLHDDRKMIEKQLKLLIPKGRIYENIKSLFVDAGFNIKLPDRTYRPDMGVDWLLAKIMKPQNVGELLELGSHDAGFTGIDWILESGAEVVEILDLGLDKVSIIAAVPSNKVDQHRQIDKSKSIVVATEYVHLAERYLKTNGYKYTIVRTYGATEVFPPDDADMIIDNTASGQTLKDNGLVIVDTILKSSTRFVASNTAMNDPQKKELIDRLAMLFKAVIEGREKVMLEMNVSKEKFDCLVAGAPAMRSPTVSPLYTSGKTEEGFAVKIAVKRNEVPDLIPRLKKLGASDIVEYNLRKVVY